MYRVLIVDDEEPVLDSFAFLLETAGTDFSLAGKARSGYEALKLIHELAPDVVFMDINIPGIDGIEVIADVHGKFPGTIFILSTAYERFDLAQRAIPLGVFAYLVKPVSKRTFLSTLDSVRSALEGRGAALPSRSADLEERQFLMETIWKEISSEEWARCRDRFGFRSDKGIVCLVEVEEDPQRWCREIAVKLSFRYRCLFVLHLNRGLFLIPEDVDREALLAYLGEILSSTIPDTIFRAYAAGMVHPGTRLHRSCGEAQAELKQKKSYADVQLRERLRVIQIRRKLALAPLEEVRQVFTALWEELFAAYDFAVAKAKMVVLFAFLLDDCVGAFSGHSEASLPFDPAAEIMPIRDLPEWSVWCLQAFNAMYNLFQLRRTGRFPLPLVKALDFINARYVDQLQLSDAADAAQVSAAYLSRLFSEHLQITFIDYLTELRVEKAEKLIRTSRMSIKEVSFAVGYRDPNYFGKIFRKATGLPPTLYAAEKRGNAEFDEKEEI
ncbi:MAG: helix-turn-helix domain-containing protein [Treponemataceae bacterium]